MTLNELFYPQLSVRIGDYALNDGVRLRVSSNQASYFDWAKVEFVGQYAGNINVNHGDEATIQLGYDNVYYDIFNGYVNQPYDAAANMNEVLLKDAMLKLEQTNITQTFLNTTPQEILQYGLNAAGVDKFEISTENYGSRSQLSIANKSVLKMINTIRTLWQITDPFYFSNNTFYFGTKPKQSEYYTFSYGINIIALTRNSGQWEIETVAMPFIRHSHVISVDHPQVSGEFEVKKVVFETNDAGFIRSYIYF